MKTVKKLIPLINFMILITFVTTGIFVGSVFEQISYGVLFGIASGLLAVMVFYYFVELIEKRIEEKIVGVKTTRKDIRKAA